MLRKRQTTSPLFRMSISRNWSQSCLDNISDKEKISKGLFPHQTSHQHLEMRYHLTVIKKLQRFVSSSNFLPALGGKIPFDGNKETSKVCFLIKLLTITWR